MSYANGFGLRSVMGLAGLGAPLPLSVSIDTQRQRVGQAAIYRISGAPPGADIWWTSFKNGVATGENRVSYGDKIEANGTAELKANPWTSDHIGEWIKQIEVQDAAGNSYLGVVRFIVEPDAQTQPGPYVPGPSSGQSFLNSELFVLGDFVVTPGVLLGVGVAAWAFKSLTSKR